MDDLLPGELNDLPNRITDIRITTALVGNMRNWTLVAVFGVLFLIFGIMANLAALGLFRRRLWGRVLTFLVAVSAISIVLVPLIPEMLFITEMTFIREIQITTNIPLQIAQVLYGILAFAVLSRNPGEPSGICIVKLINFSVGLPLMFVVRHVFIRRHHAPLSPRTRPQHSFALRHADHSQWVNCRLNVVRVLVMPDQLSVEATQDRHRTHDRSG